MKALQDKGMSDIEALDFFMKRYVTDEIVGVEDTLEVYIFLKKLIRN